MHILLLILQIILWIVLGLLALIILLLLLVLLAPVHYSADAVIHDDCTTVAAKVRFLIVSVKVKFDKGTKKLDTAIKILGIKLGGRDTEKVKVKKTKNKKIKNKKTERQKQDETTAEHVKAAAENVPEAQNDTAADGIVEMTQNDTDGIIEMTKTVQEGMKNIVSDTEADHDFNDSFDENFDDNHYNEPDIKRKETKKKQKKNKKREKKIKSSNNLNSGKNKSDVLNAKIEAVKTKYARFMKFWKMGCTLKTRKYLKKYFPGLIRHIGPRKIKGHVRYGFDEPATTGQVTGYLSLLPFMYQKNFFPEPDFYNKVLEGEISIRGRLQLGYIIRPAFKLHLWKTIKMARKI